MSGAEVEQESEGKTVSPERVVRIVKENLRYRRGNWISEDDILTTLYYEDVTDRSCIRDAINVAVEHDMLIRDGDRYKLCDGWRVQLLKY